jgi:predicted nuclease of restriction endonuclease-like (RecB) superfamily
MIVEEQQKGKQRAQYGKKLLQDLSKKLTKEFDKGFSVDNLENMRKFYILYINQISETVSRISLNSFKLSWSHYVRLLRIENEDERKFYEIESLANNWSIRELERQYNSSLYERLVLSRNKKKVKELSTRGHIIKKPEDALKEPYILEFLGLKETESYTEEQLETAIINELEEFLLELGKGFTFVARQKRITFDDTHFYIDLVFYNRLLKCFVLIDLKIGDLKHQDIGQMQMYVNYYDQEIRLKDENPTIGIILCKDKRENIVKYTLPKNNKQIFAKKYKTVLPSQQEFQKLMEPEAVYGNYNNEVEHGLQRS